MDCPRCSSGNYHKAGKVKGKQRYKCKKCHYFYTVKKKSTSQNKEIKRLALEMYLEGIGFNSIARIFNISHVSVQQWVKANEVVLKELKSDIPIEIVEFDKMLSKLSEKGIKKNRGFLLIELCQDTTNSYWVLGDQKQVRPYGKKNKLV